MRWCAVIFPDPLTLPPPLSPTPHLNPLHPTPTPPLCCGPRNILPIEQFEANLAAGNLASYTLIEPRMSASANGSCNWQHPECAISEVCSLPPPPRPAQVPARTWHWVLGGV